MKYNIKYHDLKPLEVRDNILRGRIARPCWCCGEPTEFVEINYEAPLCSEECEWAIDKVINEKCKEIFSDDDSF